MGSLGGMENRTITICSAGKSWSVTGWKTGWAIGAQNLITPMQSFWKGYKIQSKIEED